MPVRAIALRALLVSVAVAALLGIVAILGSHMGKTGIKVLVTSFAFAGASALVMASLSAWELPVARVWSRAGVTGALAGLASVVFGLWVEVNSDSYWKLAFTLVVIGCAGAHGSLVSMARLAPRHQWMRVTALANLVLLAAAVCAAVWSEHDSDAGWKAIAVFAILDVAFTLAVGALDLVNRSNAPEGGVAEVCFCPRCGRRLWQPAGEVRCGHCKAAFFIELRASEDLPIATAQK
jgi:hypothetical protein